MTARFKAGTALGSFLLAGLTGILVYAAPRGSRPVASGKGAASTARSTRQVASRVPTFNKDIAPILANNCASCHRPGEVAPFSLLSYEDARKRARLIAAVTQSRFMPPWKADPHYGEFLDARHLSEAQIDTLKQWAEGGAPEGKAADRPKAPTFVAGWQLGQPDAVLQPEQEYALGAEGEDVYRCFVVPTNYAEDRYVSAMEVRPGNNGVVHHVIAYLDTRGAARKLDAADPGAGYTSFGGVGFQPQGTLGGWAPGNMPRRLPEDIGILLPKGADVVLQVHYHKSGKPEVDRTKVGLYFSSKPVNKRLRIAPIVNPFIRIPPGEAGYQAQARLAVPTDVTVLQVMPHMHLLGREMTVKATLPDGIEKPLVRVPDWDFNWQTTYTLKEPLRLPPGSSVSLTARYDNSANNPRNPSNPPRQVTWGEQTTDEMCLAFVFYTVDSEQLTQGKPAEDVLSPFGGRRRAARQALEQMAQAGAQ